MVFLEFQGVDTLYSFLNHVSESSTRTEAFCSFLELLQRFQNSLQSHVKNGQTIREDLEEEIENLGTCRI